MNGDERWELFKCHQCGKCCTEIGLPYDPDSIFTIANHLGMTTDQVINKYYGHWVEDGKFWISDEHKRTPCQFLESVGGKMACSIYSVRPRGCKAYPFNTDGGRQGVDCPGAKTVYEKLDQDE